MRYLINVFFGFILLFSQMIYSQIIPVNRFEFISNIGLDIERPIFYDQIIDVCASPYFLLPDQNGDFQTNSIKINQIIQDQRGKPGWKLIFFSQSGTYRFANTINLTIADSNLVFKGTGSNNVLLHFKLGNQMNAHLFNLQGSIFGSPVTITNNLYRGSNTITYIPTSSFDIGNWVDIYL